MPVMSEGRDSVRHGLLFRGAVIPQFILDWPQIIMLDASRNMNSLRHVALHNQAIGEDSVNVGPATGSTWGIFDGSNAGVQC
jgi:hypothetical protein